MPIVKSGDGAIIAYKWKGKIIHSCIVYTSEHDDKIIYIKETTHNIEQHDTVQSFPDIILCSYACTICLYQHYICRYYLLNKAEKLFVCLDLPSCFLVTHFIRWPLHDGLTLDLHTAKAMACHEKFYFGEKCGWDQFFKKNPVQNGFFRKWSSPKNFAPVYVFVKK